MGSIPLREDFDADGVRSVAARCADGNQARRLLSIAAVYDGMSRSAAARVGGMDRQSLRDWVHRFNEEGPDGLVNRPLPGASPKLTPAQLEALAAVVESGPDPAVAGVVRWRQAGLPGARHRRSSAGGRHPDRRLFRRDPLSGRIRAPRARQHVAHAEDPA